MNPTAEKVTGQEFPAARGASLAQVLRPRSEPALQSALQALTAQGAWAGSLVVCARDGTERDLESRWSLQRDSSGKSKSVLITCNDVTEKKRLEAQYLRAQRLESIGTLAGGIAHDINNTLSPIILGIGILRDSIQDPELHSMLAMMEESARNGGETVKQLLTFAHGTKSSRGPVQPRYLVEEIVRVVRRSFPANIQVHADCPHELSAILADPAQLHQVLMNLCLNARDAMPEGGTLLLSIENKNVDESFVKVHPKARSVPYVVFKVTDNGTGMPPKILDRIFDPFYTTKPQGKGSGLGLPTALGIVESHCGFVLVESQPGLGTTFHVHIPAAPATAAVGAADLKPTAIPHGQQELVLVVDDEKAILRMVESVLRCGGYGTMSASSATEAGELYQRHSDRIRVVLTDIMMPFGDGRELIARIHAQNPKLPIIAMSGLATEELQSETERCGGCAFINKPFKAEELLATLANVLKGQPA